MSRMLSAGIVVAAAPAIFLAALFVNYSLVPWACDNGTMAVLHGVSSVALLLLAGLGWIGWRQWRLAVRSGNATGMELFLPLLGCLSSGMFFLLALAQWLPQFILSPCLR